MKNSILKMANFLALRFNNGEISEENFKLVMRGFYNHLIENGETGQELAPLVSADVLGFYVLAYDGVVDDWFSDLPSARDSAALYCNPATAVPRSFSDWVVT